MESKIKKIIEKMDALNEKLVNEYQAMAKKYGFMIQQRKIRFLNDIREKNKNLRIPAWKYIVPKNIRHLLSMPFIYIMIFPVLVLDIFLSVYHLAAFPLYGIPLVKRKDYIVYDRKFLDYLNIIQKVNCLYCSYVDGFFAYALEIAARTERYWCPVKAARKPKFHHGWYKDFADYGNPEEWDNKFNDKKAFNEIKDN
jgi:hypothetical protein